MCTAIKVPRQCPLVFLVMVGWKEGMAFGSGEGRGVKSGARSEVEQISTALDQKPGFFGRVKFGC
jgi:hypothetical protein